MVIWHTVLNHYRLTRTPHILRILPAFRSFIFYHILHLGKAVKLCWQTAFMQLRNFQPSILPLILFFRGSLFQLTHQGPRGLY